MIEKPEPLGAPVLRRRDEILREVIDVQRDGVRRRRARRSLVSGACLAFLVLLGWQLVPRAEVRRPSNPSRAHLPSSIEIVERAAYPIVIEDMDDDALLAELRAAGIDAGLARTGDRVMIVGR